MLFFDLDQTLLATHKINREIFEAVRQELNISMDPEDFRKSLRTILRKNMIRHFAFVTNQSVGIDPLDYLLLEEDYEGDNLLRFKEDVFKEASGLFPQVDKEEFFRAFQGHKMNYTEEMPGMLDLLQRLREKGYKLGLITNGIVEVQEAKIQGLGLRDRMDWLYISGDFGFGKPDPRIYQAILKETKTSPEDAVMVGDNIQSDIMGSLAQGIHAIYFSDLPVPYKVNQARTCEEVEEKIEKFMESKK